MTEAVHPLETIEGRAAWLVAASQNPSGTANDRRAALKQLGMMRPDVGAKAKADWVATHGTFAEPPPRKRRSK